MKMAYVASAAAALAFCTPMSLTPALADEKAEASADETASDDEKIRCRKVEVTGSLVKKTKVCRTVAEWRRMTDKGNRNARDIIESGNVCAGGPICN